MPDPSDVPVADILMPGGKPVGTRGTTPDIRRLKGGLPAAEDLFRRMADGGTAHTPAKYPGQGVILAGGGWVGFRPKSATGEPTIDVNIPGIPTTKLKFE
jgi:hypothetical protein